MVIKFCTDAGFLTTVDVGQYFMTKHTDEFLQFTEPVTCREYTLPGDDKSADPKGWIQGNTKIGPVLEVTTSFLQGKHGVEIRIESVNDDNSHSWVRMIDKKYDDNEQETSTTKTEVFAIASRSKAKAKPRRPSTTCSSSRIIPIRDRIWIDIEPGTYSNIAFPVSKQLTTLLRHGEIPRVDRRMIFGTDLSILNVGLMMHGRRRWQKAEATIKDCNIVLTRQDKNFFISELFKVIQDAILLILLYRTMC